MLYFNYFTAIWKYKCVCYWVLQNSSKKYYCEALVFINCETSDFVKKIVKTMITTCTIQTKYLKTKSQIYLRDLNCVSGFSSFEENQVTVRGYVTRVKGWTIIVYSISTRLPVNNHWSFFFSFNNFVFRNMASWGTTQRCLATYACKPCFALYVIHMRS